MKQKPIWGGRPVQTKKCWDCGIRKYLDKFPKFKRGYLKRFSYCYKCQSKRIGHWRKANPDKVLIKDRRRASSAGRRWSRFKRYCRISKITLQLSVDSWLDIIENQGCTYCGSTLPKFGVGLDRKNPKGPYSRQNVTPCCMLCNATKSNRFSFEEFLLVGKQIKKILRKRGKST